LLKKKTAPPRPAVLPVKVELRTVSAELLVRETAPPSPLA
jgi:hypothetical protein